jgi:hypothetical protein
VTQCRSVADEILRSPWLTSPSGRSSPRTRARSVRCSPRSPTAAGSRSRRATGCRSCTRGVVRRRPLLVHRAASLAYGGRVTLPHVKHVRTGSRAVRTRRAYEASARRSLRAASRSCSSPSRCLRPRRSSDRMPLVMNSASTPYSFSAVTSLSVAPFLFHAPYSAIDLCALAAALLAPAAASAWARSVARHLGRPPESPPLQAEPLQFLEQLLIAQLSGARARWAVDHHLAIVPAARTGSPGGWLVGLIGAVLLRTTLRVRCRSARCAVIVFSENWVALGSSGVGSAR